MESNPMFEAAWRIKDEWARETGPQPSCIYRNSIRTLFDAIHQLTTPLPGPPREIGYHVQEASPPYRVQRK
jgi:hypothetical protein